MNINFLEVDVFNNEAGSLISLEAKKNVPFEIKRVYCIFKTNTELRRGFHAHKNLNQVLICVNGSCKVLLDDGYERTNIELSSPSKGLIIKDFIWREIFDFSSDCVIMVLADNFYDESDYIRDYDEFLKIIKNY